MPIDTLRWAFTVDPKTIKANSIHNGLIYKQHQRCDKRSCNSKRIITAGHRGGGHKHHLYRKIDFRHYKK